VFLILLLKETFLNLISYITQEKSLSFKDLVIIFGVIFQFIEKTVSIIQTLANFFSVSKIAIQAGVVICLYIFLKIPKEISILKLIENSKAKEKN